MNWISVEERLPEPGVEVMIGAYGEAHFGELTFPMEDFPASWFVDGVGLIPVDHSTHWTAKPIPPEDPDSSP